MTSKNVRLRYVVKFFSWNVITLPPFEIKLINASCKVSQTSLVLFRLLKMSFFAKKILKMITTSLQIFENFFFCQLKRKTEVMQIVIVSCITWGWYLQNCAQLLRHAPYFLTAFADEEVEPQKKANFYRYI